MILPGATIGILGSGQLGRMLALAARRMGYGVAVYSPERDSPAGAVADREVVSAYEDLDAVRAFAASVDVVTFEFENVPAATAQAAASTGTPVRPDGRVLHITQHRLREKTFLRDHGFPVTPFAHITTLDSLRAAVSAVGLPAVLKTAGFGYDGKGQVKLVDDRPETLAAAHAALAGAEGILEAWVVFERELSVVAARSVDGAFAAWPPIANTHRHHILDVSVCPAPVSAHGAGACAELARRVLEALDVVGVLCVEMFVLPGGDLLVNELAPRPHNSGHLTIEASPTSQFEQQLRAVCGLPLGDTSLHRPAAMANLLGDLWPADFAAALAVPGVALHLYGKREARPGRKMGHLTAVADTTVEAERRVVTARDALAHTRRG